VWCTINSRGTAGLWHAALGYRDDHLACRALYVEIFEWGVTDLWFAAFREHED
jgi:hypothetical protein